jgi:hypothetical protein
VVPRIGQRVDRRGVRSRWIVEVTGGQTGRLIVIGCLVPFVLGGDEEPRAGATSKQRLVADIVIRAVLDRSRTLRPSRLTVVEPVGKSGRVSEAHMVHRPVGPIVRDAVTVVGRRTGSLDVCA